MESRRFIEALRELSRTEPQVRRFVIIVSCVLTGIFLIGLAGVALLVRSALAPDGKRVRKRRARSS